MSTNKMCNSEAFPEVESLTGATQLKKFVKMLPPVEKLQGPLDVQMTTTCWVNDAVCVLCIIVVAQVRMLTRKKSGRAW